MLHRVAEEVFVVEVGETEAGVEGFGLRFVDVDDEADGCSYLAGCVVYEYSLSSEMEL